MCHATFQNNALSMAEAGATSFLVNSSHLLGDGVWTPSQAAGSDTTLKSEEIKSIEIFKTSEFYPVE